MNLLRLKLRNFRNYESLDLNFEEKVNLLTGPNGSGKTNLSEAVFFLSFGKSWRTLEPGALIKKGADSALISATIKEGDLLREIEIEILKKGKKISINNHSVSRLSELSSIANVLLFSPEDASFFKGPPSRRRAFLDSNLAKKSDEYVFLLKRYLKLLQERNALLKAENPNLNYLNVVTKQLIEVSAPIDQLRSVYVDSLNKTLSLTASQLYGEDRRLKVDWKPFASLENFKEAAFASYQRTQESDLFHKTTSLGIHREDFVTKLDGREIEMYGSQGENRIAALALKLTPYFLIGEVEKKPIVVLDDVFSELDEEHNKRLNSLIHNLGQVFITTTEASIDSNDCLIEVSQGSATRRN